MESADELLNGYYTAATAINTKGLGGANDAIVHVGFGNTLLLLAGWARERGISKKRFKNLLQSQGLLNVFVISGDRAVVYSYSTGEYIAAFEARVGITKGKISPRKARAVEKPIAGLHIHMWMSGGNDKQYFAGNPPFTEAKKLFLRYCISEIQERVRVVLESLANEPP